MHPPEAREQAAALGGSDVEAVADVEPGEGARLGVARTLAAGVNSNLLADESIVDPLSGNGVLTGIPVQVSPA